MHTKIPRPDNKRMEKQQEGSAHGYTKKEQNEGKKEWRNGTWNSGVFSEQLSELHHITRKFRISDSLCMLSMQEE